MSYKRDVPSRLPSRVAEFSFLFFFASLSFLFLYSLYIGSSDVRHVVALSMEEEDEIGIKHIPFFTVSVDAERVDSLGGVLRWLAWVVSRGVAPPRELFVDTSRRLGIKAPRENYFSTLPRPIRTAFLKQSFLTYVRKHISYSLLVFFFAIVFPLFVDLLIIREKEIFVNNFLN